MRRFGRCLFETTAISSLFIILPCFYFGGSFDSFGTFMVRTTVAADSEEGVEGPSITGLKVEPLYRAVRLTWRLKKNVDGLVTFEIYRSMATPDQPYTLVTSLETRPEVNKYKYIDKQLPVEENYFYKIVIPETNESFGPLQVRPPFSLPTT